MAWELWLRRGQGTGLVGNWAKKKSFDLLGGGQAGLGTPASPTHRASLLSFCSVCVGMW